MSLAVVFPGQGSHRAGMASAWLDHPASSTFDEVGRACGLQDLRRLADDPEACASTLVGQPAVFAASLAAWRALERAGIEPSYVAGHSLGELTAATAAGALSVHDGAALVGERARAFAVACQREHGGMVAVLGMDIDEVEALVADVPGVVVANDNAAGQVVVAGPSAALMAASDRWRAEGARARRLEVEGAFHTAAMTPAVVRFGAVLRRSPLAPPHPPLVRGLDASVARTGREVARGLIDGILGRVRWREVQLTLAANGVTTLIEAGPGGVLRGLARRSGAALEAITVDGPDAVLGLDSLAVGATR